MIKGKVNLIEHAVLKFDAASCKTSLVAVVLGNDEKDIIKG